MASSGITKFFNLTPKPVNSDNIILAPESINPRHDLDAVIRPDKFELYGRQYIRCNALAKDPKATKKRSSVVWIYGEDIQLKDSKKTFWYCYLCEKQRHQQELPAIGNGNSTALDHLYQKHNVDKVTGEHRAKSFREGSDTSSQLSISESQGMKSLVFTRRLDHFKELFIRWLVCCHVAFFQIENIYFRDLLFYLFPPLAKLLPKAASTLRQWVMDAFEQKKDKLRQGLHNARSNISLSFDLWTSPNCLAILGIVAHFIDKDGKRRNTVLALRELEGEHSAIVG